MIWNSDDLNFGQWYVQCQRDKTKSFVVYELKKFQCKEILNKVIGRIKNEKTT